MRLFVLDEDGNVVFEFNTDVKSVVHNYRLSSSMVVQAKVIGVIREALQFLGRRP